MIETSKEFMMCPHPLFLEASLDKEVMFPFFIFYFFVIILCYQILGSVGRFKNVN